MCASQGLFAPPSFNFYVIAGEQDLGYSPAPIFRWTGVVRVFQQSRGVGIIHGTIRVTKDAGEQAGNGIDQDQCRELPPGQHIIADRDFIRDQVLPDPLIDALVAAAEKRKVRMLDQFEGHFLGEEAPLRGEQNDRADGLGSKDILHRCKDRFHLHHHPAATPIRFIIGDMVFIRGMLADIMDTDINYPVLAGAFQNTTVEVWGKYFREQCKNIKLHGAILVDSGLSDKRGAGIDAGLNRMVR